MSQFPAAFSLPIGRRAGAIASRGSPLPPPRRVRCSRFRWPSGRCTVRSSPRRARDPDSEVRRAGQEGLRHRRRRVRQPVLQGQEEGRRLPEGPEEARRRQRRPERAHHVRRRREPRRPRRQEAQAGRREPLPLGRCGQVPRLPLHPRQCASDVARYEEQTEAARPTACAG